MMTINKNKNLTRVQDTLSEIEFKTKIVSVENALAL